MSTAVLPDGFGGDFELLVWILPLVPAFLLSFHHGWRGASVALAAGMAALALSQAMLSWLGRGEGPPPLFALGFIVVLIVVSLGSGWIASEFKASLQRARDEALTDHGTGLPNRRSAGIFLEKAFYAAERGTKLSVVLFDIDRFKSVNDTHGHATGDQVLRLLAEVLKGKTRQMNLSSRHGGEEFLSILNQTDAEGAAIFADRVRRAFAEADGPVPGRTVSAGVAEYEEGMASPDVLIAAADQALYRAKQNGRDRVEVLGRMGRRADPAKVAVPIRDVLAGGKGERVLVVDDDHAARRGMARGLQRVGYSVLEADSAARALQILKGIGEPIDLVVTDIVMPDVGGFRLMQMIAEVQPTVRAVYVSGYSQEEVDWNGVPGSAWAFISKPISLDELARTVRSVLERAADAPDPGRAAAPAAAAAGEAGEDDDDSWLQPLLTGADARLQDARVAVVHRSQLAPTLVDTMRRAGFRKARLIRDLADLEREGPHDLVVAELDPQVREHLSRRRREDEERSGALLLLGASETNRARLDLLDLGLVEVIDQASDALLVATTARNLLRLRYQEIELRQLRASRDAAEHARVAERNEAGAEMLRRLARAAEHRDELTSDHAERVGRLAGAIAGELGWSPERCHMLEEAAILHDVGKIAVPDAVLRKPDRLTPAERTIMQEHTIAGARILSGSRNPILVLAEEIALSHHERWDGRGYPLGRGGPHIPESGRIVAVADSYDTMIHLRPYRAPLTEEQAVLQVVAESGNHFDPDVVEAFLKVQRQGRIREVVSSTTVAFPDELDRAEVGAQPGGGSR